MLNLDIIHTLKQIQLEKRPASPQEKDLLCRFNGWGSYWKIFRSDATGSLLQEQHRLRALLTPEEYRIAQSTILNAHYTDPAIVGAMWRIVTRMGFRGGRVLEPSCGVGYFLQGAPSLPIDWV